MEGRSIFRIYNRLWCLLLCFFLGLTLVQCGKLSTDEIVDPLRFEQPTKVTDPPATNSFSASTISTPQNPTPVPSEKETDKKLNGDGIDDQNLAVNQQQKPIIDAFNKLDEGLFFSNIPRDMQVGRKEIIEAGIAKEKVDIQGLVLDGSGKLVIEKGIVYNPLSVKIDLNVDSEDFDVKAISTGNKTTIAPNGKPEKWQWQITPLSAGTRNIFLTANVSFDVPELKSKFNRDIKATAQEVLVKRQLLQTISAFLLKHWLKLLIILLSPVFGHFFWTLLIEKLLSRKTTVKSDV